MYTSRYLDLEYWEIAFRYLDKPNNIKLYYYVTY